MTMKIAFLPHPLTPMVNSARTGEHRGIVGVLAVQLELGTGSSRHDGQPLFAVKELGL
jgi:hypothetical protein